MQLARRTWNDFLYVSMGLPLGTVWAVVLAVGLGLGVGTSVVTLGIPVLAAMLLIWRWGANLERERAALVLGAPIPRAHRPLGQGVWQRWRQRLRDPATWRDLGYMILLVPAGIAAGTVVVSAWALALACLAAPALAPLAPEQSGLGELSAIGMVAVALGGVLAAGAAVLVTRALAIGCAALARALLQPDERTMLAQRVSALEQTRSAAVDSSDARLRRIERDLHDGAQHRLAYVAMELGRARGKLADDPEAAGTLVAAAHEESKRALAELRDLVRGIHPSVLTDRGLDAAISGLAERCPVPVDVSVDLERRLPAAAETAAYYVVAEALMNVGKHAGASTASVSVGAARRRLRGGGHQRRGRGIRRRGAARSRLAAADPRHLGRR